MDNFMLWQLQHKWSKSCKFRDKSFAPQAWAKSILDQNKHKAKLINGFLGLRLESNAFWEADIVRLDKAKLSCYNVI